MSDKDDLIKSFFPKTVEETKYIQIDLDATDLSIPDILRNLNIVYPQNSRDRFRISNNEKVVAVLATSELLDPYVGILLILCGDSSYFNIVSKNLIVAAISDEFIEDNDKIQIIIDKITTYLYQLFKDEPDIFKKFYAKFIYDPYEMYEE